MPFGLVGVEKAYPLNWIIIARVVNFNLTNEKEKEKFHPLHPRRRGTGKNYDKRNNLCFNTLQIINT